MDETPEDVFKWENLKPSKMEKSEFLCFLNIFCRNILTLNYEFPEGEESLSEEAMNSGRVSTLLKIIFEKCVNWKL